MFFPCLFFRSPFISPSCCCIGVSNAHDHLPSRSSMQHARSRLGRTAQLPRRIWTCSRRPGRELSRCWRKLLMTSLEFKTFWLQQVDTVKYYLAIFLWGISMRLYPTLFIGMVHVYGGRIVFTLVLCSQNAYNSIIKIENSLRCYSIP